MPFSRMNRGAPSSVVDDDGTECVVGVSELYQTAKNGLRVIDIPQFFEKPQSIKAGGTMETRFNQPFEGTDHSF